MKKLILFAFAAIVALSSFAQTGEEVALVTNGQGSTKREATENALRSAIEQAFGVFVSANTEILNDELVKDEIATVASGNIQSYEEISSSQLSEDKYEVMIKAVVSINKLVSYAKSHGSSCELAGQKFLMEQKMIELKQENTVKAMEHFCNTIKEYVKSTSIWESNLEVGTPQVNSKDNTYRVPMTISFSLNKLSLDFLVDKTISLINNLKLSTNETMLLESMGMNTYTFSIALDVNEQNISKLKKFGIHNVTFSDPYGNIFHCDINDIIEDRANGGFRIKSAPKKVMNLIVESQIHRPNEKYNNKLPEIVKEIQKTLVSQRYVVYDNNDNLYFVLIDKQSYDYQVKRKLLGEGCLVCNTRNKPINTRMIDLQQQTLANRYSFQGNTVISREQLAKITDFKLELYNFSPMKAIYGESYDVACEKMDLSLLKNIQIFEMHKLNPTEESAVGCAKTCMKTGDYEDAIKYFTQAIELAPEEDKEDRAGYLFNIAYIYFDKFKSYEQSRQYLRRSLEQKDGQGRCYLLMGLLYAASKPYGEETTYEAAILNKTVFWVAVDKFLKAKEVDPIVADDANKLIARYSKYFPTTEEISALSELQEGASFMVGGWIQETTTCRAAN